MKILFTCGGTAGHINPAIGVAGRLKELYPDTQILFVGARGCMETELVPKEGYALKTVSVSGLQRSLRPKMLLKNIKAAAQVLTSPLQARAILKSFRPDVAVGTGGYVCYPVLRAASAMGIPTLVHESNAVPGLTTRRLERRVDRVLLGLEAGRSQYRHPEKIAVTGTPVRVDFSHIDRAAAREQLGLAPEEPVVLAMFGSLGAGAMNRLLTELLLQAGESPLPFRLVWATGSRYYDEILARLQGKIPPNAEVCRYIFDMPARMAAADAVLCRSGASTISELTYLGKPSVLVPSPNVVNHHQEKNAAVLEKAGAALVLPEAELNARRLAGELTALLADKSRLAAMGEAARALGVPDATERIEQTVISMVRA